MVLFLPEAQAGGPGGVIADGTPVKWDTAGLLTFHVDGGGLGQWNNATAVSNVTEAFDRWGPDLPTSIIDFSPPGSIPVGDGDIDTASEFNQVLNSFCSGPPNGFNPVIFDDDGSLFSAYGFPSNVIAIASPCWYTATGEIFEGLAAFNGKFFDGNPVFELTEEEFKGTLVHEFGHWLNLDHSQTNGNYFRIDTDPGFDEFIPIFGPPPPSSVEVMFPFAIGGSSVPVKDDIAAISRLYPAGGFGSSTGTIKGTIFLSDGLTPFKGANIIARNVLDPYNDAVSNVSGKPFASPTSNGEYELPGLTDGASYSVEMINVDPDFDGASSVGPLDPPAPIPGDEEFYNGVNEANTNPPDIISVYASVASVGGTPTTSIDIIINEPTADLSLLKDDSPDPILEGETLTYTLTVSNKGADTASLVTLMDMLPSGVMFLNAIPSQGTCSPPVGNDISCNLFSMAKDDVVTVVISVIPPSEGTLINNANVSSPEADPNLSDNSASTTTTVNALSMDLQVLKSITVPGGLPASMGDIVNFEMTIINNGPDDGTLVTLSDLLPVEVTFISATPSQGSCMEVAGTVSCNLGDLAIGTSATVTISSLFSAAGVYTLANTASVGGNENDPDTGNNSDTASLPVTVLGIALTSSGTGAGGGPGSSSSYLMDLGAIGQGITGSAGSSSFQLEAGFVPTAAEN